MVSRPYGLGPLCLETENCDVGLGLVLEVYIRSWSLSHTLDLGM